MVKIKCLLLDDEPLALNILENYIGQFPHLQLVGKCSNAIQGIAVLKNNPVDLLFLDIQMPVLNGITLLKSLANPPKVIFTTAYREYAVESYDLNVLDYLLKPVSLERFVIAINKYQPVFKPMDAAIPVSKNNDERFIFFRANKKMVKVFMKDILWIESIKDYVKIKTPAQTIVTNERISYLEEKLPDDMFIRIHRSFIVSVTHIQSYTATDIQIASTELPIGRLYKNEVLKQLKAD